MKKGKRLFSYKGNLIKSHTKLVNAEHKVPLRLSDKGKLTYFIELNTLCKTVSINNFKLLELIKYLTGRKIVWKKLNRQYGGI